MSAIVTEKFRLHNAKQFKESFNESGTTSNTELDSNYYLFIGKNNSYIDGDNYGVANSVSDSVPPVPQDDVTRESYNWDSMIAAKRITESDVAFVIPRRNWANNTTYDMYQHDIRPPSGLDLEGNSSTSEATSLWLSSYYFVTSTYNVYKVLDNNGGEPYNSSTEPSGTDSNAINHGNYYIKYMYTLSVNEIDKFVTSTFIPVTTNSVVSTAASNGSIDVLKVKAGGDGYTDGTFYTPINGDGTGTTSLLSGGAASQTGTGSLREFTLDNNVDSENPTSKKLIHVTVNDIVTHEWTRSGTTLTFNLAATPAVGAVVKIVYACAIAKLCVTGSAIAKFRAGDSSYSDIQDPGKNYTYGFIDFTNVYSDPELTTLSAALGGTGAIVNPIISPNGGHGKNAIDELGAHFVMVNAKLLQSEGDDITVANDFRQLGIMSDPTTYGSTTTKATDTTVRQTYAVYISPTGLSGNFIPDEQITQANTLAIGRVVEWDSTNNILYYVQEKHPTYGTSNSAGTKNKYVAFSGTTGNTITGSISAAVGLPSAVSGNSITLSGGNSITFNTSGYSNPELQPDSGNILYIENRRPISRASDQTEDIKITIEF
jgi:hypothetical protein